MAQVRVVVHRRELDRLRKGDGPYRGVVTDIDRRTRAVYNAAGPGHDTETFVGHDRYRGHVYAQTVEAKLAESRDRSLTRALDAGL